MCVVRCAEYLDQMINQMPHAKFVLSTRNATAWAASIANHGNPVKLLQRMRDNDVPGLPVGAWLLYLVFGLSI